ncbi:RNA polymerase sigma-70 factor (ECF subfamily) [Humitalea rosea]|uniref:RNA polymerase sigma-70 factor (ECF subfamily) n=1 Tax=Humitalea rosea TaxID=990373 RepID=A0A2W7IIV1_9PROT|nr:sigma-70 family RNA polymerase sigma factor [Humitalea rosea]PZW45109.1 RNA polymerase sigma-70 factor (ECF subfamily) [Humitalea rosea]
MFWRSAGVDAGQIERHIPALRRFAWALLRDGAAADDLVQDCLERALSRWHLHRADGDLRAWLFTILHNLFRNGRRSVARRGNAVPIEDDAGHGIADDAAGGAAEGHLIWQDALAGLAALPEEQRSVLLLVGVEGFSYEEAARLLGVPLGTVMSRLSRGRERLHRLIEGENAPARPALRRVK